MRPQPEKEGLHPRNRHRERYDFPALARDCPELSPFLTRTAFGDLSIDFADPRAVKALNRALLIQHYGVLGWDIPPGYLCPPIPGRADYLHHLADLLSGDNRGAIPRGTVVRALDLGTGANLIYPLLGCREYGWRFVGTEVDATALASARRTLKANPDLAQAIQLRRQSEAMHILEGVIEAGERFDLCLCNPPFHASAKEARESSRQKWQKLGRTGDRKAPILNFGGQNHELWCEGGEVAFLRRMVSESAQRPGLCLWFTSLVAKSTHLPGLRAAVQDAGAVDCRVIDMAQGQKQSRILAWTYLDAEARNAWAQEHWRTD